MRTTDLDTQKRNTDHRIDPHPDHQVHQDIGTDITIITVEVEIDRARQQIIDDSIIRLFFGMFSPGSQYSRSRCASYYTKWRVSSYSNLQDYVVSQDYVSCLSQIIIVPYIDTRMKLALTLKFKNDLFYRVVVL